MSSLNQPAIEAKQRWAAKQKASGARAEATPNPSRLPPGQRLTTGFPVLDLGIHPEVARDEWALTIDGAVEHPLSFDWEAFSRLPQVEDVSDIHCVTTWTKFDCRWRGVAFTEIHERARPRSSAAFVWFEAFDDYTVNLPLEVLLDDDVLLATHFDGTPLSVAHGWPLRVIVPKRYAWKGAKWVRRIHFMEDDRLGFWERRGYSNSADPFTNDRYS